MRLIVHAFEHTPLLNNVEEEFGDRSSFDSQRVRVQANMAYLNSILAQGEKERPLRELCFSQLMERELMPSCTLQKCLELRSCKDGRAGIMTWVFGMFPNSFPHTTRCDHKGPCCACTGYSLLVPEHAHD